MSVSTIWRWLNEDALKPWRHRSWIFPRDPAFAAKAGVVLDLYARRFQGRRLERAPWTLLLAELLTVVDQPMQPMAVSLWLSPSAQSVRGDRVKGSNHA